MIITSTSTPDLSCETEYNSGLAWMYLWQLLDLDALPEPLREPIKLGFAKHAYTKIVKGERIYTHGAQSRIIGNLAEIERAYVLSAGSLRGRVIALKLDQWDDVLASEQFVHTNRKNLDNKIVNILARDYPTQQRAWMQHGGKTEWYNAPEKTMLARFRNSWRKTNQEIGRAVMQRKRDSGGHGVPVFAERYLEGGGA